MAVSVNELESMLVRLIGDGSSYQKMLDQAQAATRSAADQIQQSGKQIEGIGDSLKSFASNAVASMSAISAIAAGTGVGISAFTEFDKAMVESTAIMKVTEEQTVRMRETALSLANGAQGATTVAKSYFYLASAGLDAERAIATLPAVIAFATAGNFDMATATTLAADAQAALGLKVKDAQKNLENMTRVTDVLVRANVLANANTLQFSQALTSGAAASAKSFGKDMEEVVAVLAAFAEQGVKGQKAGSDLSRVMRLLATSAVENVATHKQLGLEIFDENGKMRNLADIIANLEQILGGMDDRSKATALDMLGFQARVQGVILPLIGSSDAIRGFEKELRAAGGTTAEVAEKMKTSLSYQLNSFRNQLNLVAIDIGRMLAPSLAYVTNLLSGMLEWWRGLSQGVRGATVAITLFVATAAGIGPIMRLLAPIGGMLASGFTPLFSGLAVAGKLLANPFMILIHWMNPTFVLLRNVISLVAALVVYVQKSGGIGEAWRNFEETLIGVYDWLQPIISALSDLASTIVQKVIEAFFKMGEAMLSTIKYIGGLINVDWMKVQTVIVDGIKFIEFAIINMGGIAKMVGQGLYSLIKPLISMFSSGESAATGFSISLESLIKHIITITLIIAGSIVVWNLVSGTIAILTTVFKLLHLDMVIGIAVWVLYTSTVLILKGIMIIASGVMALFNGVLMLTGSIVAATTISIAALGTLLVVGFTVGTIAAAGSITLLGTAIAALVSPFVGAYAAVYALVDVISSIPTDVGPVKAVIDTFKDWGNVIDMIVQAMRVDMPLAWKIFEAGVELGIAQIKQLWSPLITFLGEGLAIVGRVFMRSMKEAFEYIDNRSTISAQLWLGQISGDQAEEMIGKLGTTFANRMKSIGYLAKTEMAKAVSNFIVPDSDDVNKAKTKVAGLKGELDKVLEDKMWADFFTSLEDPIATATDDAKKKAEELGKAWGDKTLPPISKTHHEIQKIEQAIIGSADAMTRLQHYTDMFNMKDIKDTSIQSAINLMKPVVDSVDSLAGSETGVGAATSYATSVDSALRSMGLDLHNLPTTESIMKEMENTLLGTPVSSEFLKGKSDEQILEILRLIEKHTQETADNDWAKFFEDADLP